MKENKEYDSKTLKKLQNVELDMLKDFINLCNKYNIDYFAIDGTALGAIRHKGIIPWDDDIDLGLLREDYEKFIKYAELEYGNKYYFVDCKTDKDFFLPSGKWCKSGTIFVPGVIKEIKNDLGIFLDIFPYDYVSDHTKTRNKQIIKAWLYGKLAILRSIPQPPVYYSGIKKKIILLCCRIGNLVLRLCHINGNKLLNKGFNFIIKSKEKTNTIAFAFDTEPFRCIYKVADIFPTKKAKFNGLDINIPNNVEYLLTNMYGDYMKLPPLEERRNHYPYKLDFGNIQNKKYR